VPSDDLPGLEADDDEPSLERESDDSDAPEPSLPPHLDGEKYLPGLEGDPEGAVLENWSDADWAAWFEDNVRGVKVDLAKIPADDMGDAIDIVMRTQPDKDMEGTFEGAFEADQSWKFARLSSEKRERFFHLFYAEDQAFGRPEPPTRGGSTKKVAVIGGTTLAAVLIAVLIVLIARDGDGSTPAATTAPTSVPEAQPSVAPPPEEEEAAPSPEPTEAADDIDTTAPDPLVGLPGATVEAVLVGRTLEGVDQVQVILAGDGRDVADDPATETYGVGVNVIDEEGQEFFVDGEFVDAATYISKTFDADGNPIADAAAAAEFFDGGIFMEFLTPGYGAAETVDVEVWTIIDGIEVRSAGSSADAPGTG
jgi:hypothetical protein